MELSDRERQLLLAVIERILPADEVPHVAQEKVAEHVLGQMQPDAEPLKQWLLGLSRESFSVLGGDFAEMHVGMRDEILDRIEAGNCRTDWGMDPTDFFGRIIEAVGKAYRELYPAQ